ncbi:EF-hand domain-containing protein [Algicella marina]|nr:hypothetical protein [Algicella marina]
MATRATTLALILTTVSLAAPAMAQQGQPQGGERLYKAHAERSADHKRGGKFSHRAAGRMMQLFEQYDANDDGSLTQEELTEGRNAQLGSFDADSSGGLTLEEYQNLWLDAMRERMVDQFQSHDDDGDGIVTAEEFGERFEGLVARLDRNGDGALNREDMRRGPMRGGAEEPAE